MNEVTKCKECVKNFISDNPGRTFPYIMCKRCENGMKTHESTDCKWSYDYVKQDY